MMSELDIRKINTAWQTTQQLTRLQPAGLEPCISRDFPLESRKDKVTQQGGQEFSQDLGRWGSTAVLSNLSWEIHSKSFILVTFSSISLAATSLAWTSITIRADSTARCILDSLPRTRATKSASWRAKGKYPEAIYSVPTQCNQTQGMLNLRLYAVLRQLLPLLLSEVQMIAQKANTTQGWLRAEFCLHYYHVQVERKS